MSRQDGGGAGAAEHAGSGPRGEGSGWLPAVALAAVLAVGACAGRSVPPEVSTFHEHFEEARYRSAAEIFRSDTTLRTDPRALARMGLLHASPSSPVYDPDRAVEVLDTLRRRHPESEESRAAELMVPLLRKVQGLESAVDSMVLRTRAVARARMDSLSAAADSLRSETGDLRTRIGELERVITELRTQLRRLKAVDLGEEPAPDSTRRIP